MIAQIFPAVKRFETGDSLTFPLVIPYNGYIKKLFGLIFILSHDVSMFEPKDNKGSDLLMCFTYHTYNVYLEDKEITDFSSCT